MTHDHEHHDHEHHDHEAEELDYVAQVEAFRADKDDAFRYSPGSPIPHDVRHDFAGLPYFPVDESLRFEGLRLEEYAGDQPTSFQIPTSDNQLKPAPSQGLVRIRARRRASPPDGLRHRRRTRRFGVRAVPRCDERP